LVDNYEDINLLCLKKSLSLKHKELQKLLEKPVFIEHKDTFETLLNAEDLLERMQEQVTAFDTGDIGVEHSAIFSASTKVYAGEKTYFTV